MAVLLRRADPYTLHLDAEDGRGLPEPAACVLRAAAAPHANPPDLVGRQPPGGVQDRLHGARWPGRGEKTQESRLRPGTSTALKHHHHHHPSTPQWTYAMSAPDSRCGAEGATAPFWLLTPRLPVFSPVLAPLCPVSCILARPFCGWAGGSSRRPPHVRASASRTPASRTVCGSQLCDRRVDASLDRPLFAVARPAREAAAPRRPGKAYPALNHHRDRAHPRLNSKLFLARCWPASARLRRSWAARSPWPAPWPDRSCRCRLCRQAPSCPHP